MKIVIASYFFKPTFDCVESNFMTVKSKLSNSHQKSFKVNKYICMLRSQFQLFYVTNLLSVSTPVWNCSEHHVVIVKLTMIYEQLPRHIFTCRLWSLNGSGPLEDWLTKQLSRFLNLEAADGLQRLWSPKPIQSLEEKKDLLLLPASKYYDTSIAQKARCWVDAKIAKSYKVHTANIVKLDNDYNMASIVDKQWLACHCGFFLR